MIKKKTYTDRVLTKITVFIVIVIFLWSIVVAKQTWHGQCLVKERETNLIATTILNQVASHFNEISINKQNQDLSDNQKVLASNQVLQKSIEEISMQYPDYGIGYYDIELNSVIAIAPNFNQSLLKEVPRTYPYFKSYESGKPEFVIKDTSISWAGKPIIAVTVPVYYEGKIIGHTWANIKSNNLFLFSIFEAGKTISMGLIVWLIVIYIIRKNVRLSLNILNDFSQQIAEEKQDEVLFSKIPELTPVLEKIQLYTNSLKESNNQCYLSKSLLNTIVGGITDGFYALDNAWRFTYVNEGAIQASFKQHNLIGKSIWDEYPQAVGSEIYIKLHEAKAKNIPMYLETNSLLTDKYHSFSAYPYPNGITVFFRDITEEKQTKDQLAQLATIVESSNDAIVSMTLDGVITTWNSAAESMFGYKDEEVIGKHMSILVPEGFLYEEQILDTIRSGKRVNSLETVRSTKQGLLINVTLSVSPLIDENNKVYGASTIAHDITQRIIIAKQLKEEIIQRKHSEDHFKAVFDNSMLGIVTGTIDGKVLKANKAFQDIVGYSEEELMYLDWKIISHPEDILEQIELDEQLRSGNRDHYELKKRYIRKDGTIIWVSLMSVMTSREANKEFIITFVQDITEKKLLEEQMVKFDRLHLIGEMAAGISHEVRNPMATVRGFLQILMNKVECTNYTDFFEIMIEELDRANTIITEFLSIGGNTPAGLKEENLNDIVESLRPLIEASGYEQDKYLEIETSEVPRILLNNKEIRQIILNLCRNGFQAMSPGGSLKIKTFYQDGKVILAVQDEGEGIKPEVLEKLGTPFFTTKKNGTGLGLGICYGIAARHNADISIDTGPSGTAFYVKFKVENIVSIEENTFV